MDTLEQHMRYALGVGARIEEILRRHGIHTERQPVPPLGDGRFAASWEAARGNVVLAWSIGHDGGGGSADYLAILLRIDRPDDPDQTLQQFKLLLLLSTKTWHRSTAGQLGFALGYGEPDLDEARAMETVERLARWFISPDHATTLLPAHDESDL